MKRLVTAAFAASLLWMAPAPGWAQEADEGSCDDACYEIEEACFEACSSEDDSSACESECSEETDRCVEQCED